MKKNGVDDFNPSQGAGGFGQGVDQQAFQKAMQACRSLAPQRGSGGAPGNGQSSAQFQKFQQCLKDNGVSGGFGPGAQGSRSQADQDKFQKAIKACGSLAPQGFGRNGQGRAGQGGTSGDGGNFAAFSRCMKRNGVELPGPGSTKTTPVDTTSAKYQKAQKACQSLLGTSSTNGATQ